MCLSKKQTKKKWVIAAALIVTATLIPAEASSPNLPHSESRQLPEMLKCVQKSTGDSLVATWGRCDAGSDDCCFGKPEAKCDSEGHGGFEAI